VVRYYLVELTKLPDVIEARITYTSYAVRFIIGTDYNPDIKVSIILNAKYHMIRITTQVKTVSIIMMEDKQYVKIGRARVPIRNKYIMYALYAKLLINAKNYIRESLW
jgi:hypothetical protein